MADIFLSYSKEDRDLAVRYINALEAVGYSVWWDESITPERSWDVVIEQELEACSVVMVLWTEEATGETSFVRREAIWAERHGKLISVIAKSCKLPVAVHTFQAIDLVGWNFDVDDRNWRKLLGWIHCFVEKSEPIPDQDRELGQNGRTDDAALGVSARGGGVTKKSGRRPGGGRTVPLIGLAGLGLFVGAGALWVVMGDAEPAGPAAPVDARRLTVADAAPVVEGPLSWNDFDTFRDCDACPELVVLPLMAGTTERVAIGRFEVTIGQWRACVDEGACVGGDRLYGNENNPVREVTYRQASAYAAWVSELTGERYALPTFAHWRSARVADVEASGVRLGDIESYAVIKAEAASRVGSRRPNAWGLYDLTGNVEEWLLDCHQQDQSSSECIYALTSGGSYATRDTRELEADQYRIRPTSTSFPDIGFRLARAMP